MRRVLAVMLVCALGACRFGFDSHDGGSNGDDGGGHDGGGGDDGGSIDASADAMIDAMVTCPGNYVQLSGVTGTSRYRVVNTSSSWDAAEAACEADGHHLAIPDGTDEVTAMYTALFPQNIWFGVTDRITEGTYRKVTGGLQTLLVWDAGEPDAEDCLYQSGMTALMVMQDCTSGRRYICECDGVLADPAAY